MLVLAAALAAPAAAHPYEGLPGDASTGFPASFRRALLCRCAGPQKAWVCGVDGYVYDSSCSAFCQGVKVAKKVNSGPAGRRCGPTKPGPHNP